MTNQEEEKIIPLVIFGLTPNKEVQVLVNEAIYGDRVFCKRLTEKIKSWADAQGLYLGVRKDKKGSKRVVFSGCDFKK